MITEDKDFAEKNAETLSEALKDVFGRIAPLASAGKNSLCSALRGPEAHCGFGRLLK